jgi:hypothetical protein
MFASRLEDIPRNLDERLTATRAPIFQCPKDSAAVGKRVNRLIGEVDCRTDDFVLLNQSGSLGALREERQVCTWSGTYVVASWNMRWICRLRLKFRG